MERATSQTSWDADLSKRATGANTKPNWDPLTHPSQVYPGAAIPPWGSSATMGISCFITRKAVVQRYGNPNQVASFAMNICYSCFSGLLIHCRQTIKGELSIIYKYAA